MAGKVMWPKSSLGKYAVDDVESRGTCPVIITNRVSLDRPSVMLQVYVLFGWLSTGSS
jgi:hypothetical protein